MSKELKTTITRNKIETLLIVRQDFMTQLVLFFIFSVWINVKNKNSCVKFYHNRLAIIQKFALLFLFFTINAIGFCLISEV